MTETEVNADLLRERSKCTFNVRELTEIIDGGPEKTLERKEREAYGDASLRELGDSECSEEYLSHVSRYENSVRKSCYIFKQVRQMLLDGKTIIDAKNYRHMLSGILNSSLVRDGSPLGLHYMMFMPAILNLGSEEQLAEWLLRAAQCQIIGSFAQTELGHGTFIRGLETTATYDEKSQEFVLNTPTLASTKWWPGGLGHTANYCIVVAQLYTLGQCHGVHSFMVQVRDEETHRQLPGIRVGDIGAKLGLNTVNNGFMILDNVRIPRKNMLMKHAKVLEDGTYVKSVNSKLNYSAMMFVRVVIVFDMVNYLAKAVTIATRYSAVRRQCQLKENEGEIQILDYQTQQHKLFPALATAHALRVTASHLWDSFQDTSDQLSGGNLDNLPELHALACCLKAVSTTDTTACVERCRLACGGHGYMTSSNLPLLYGLVTAACTYEGENTVLLLQTARFLTKTWQQMSDSRLTPTVRYLRETSAAGFSARWEPTVPGIILAFQVVAMRKISSCVDVMSRKVAAGAAPEDAWNSTSVQLVAAAEAHCRALILSFYQSATEKQTARASGPLRPVLRALCDLYAVHWALERLADLLQYTLISGDDIQHLKTWYDSLLETIRPNAVSLVDAFDIKDNMLQSTLGSFDGRVYERLMAEALKSPLNAEPVNRSFHTHLKPFMQGKL